MKMQAKMHFEAYIFDANSHQGPGGIVFLHLARRVPSEMKSHKIRWTVVLRRPGGMRGGAGGRLDGGLRSADLRFAISDLCFGFDTPALAIRQGRRIQSLCAFRRDMERRYKTGMDMRELKIR